MHMMHHSAGRLIFGSTTGLVRIPPSHSSMLMSTNSNYAALHLYVDIMPYFSNTHETIVMHEGVDGFAEAAFAMADECDLHLYNGVLYNMPYKVDSPPPYYCVSRGRYIGVFVSCVWYVCHCHCRGVTDLFTRKDIESDIRKCPNAVYFCVDSLKVGEEKVRVAIEQGEAVNLGPYHFRVYHLLACPRHPHLRNVTNI